MLRQRTLSFALAVATTLGIGACSDDTVLPTAPAAVPDLAQVGAQQELADDPVALARAVPGFGGFFVDDQGTPTVYLANPGQRGEREARRRAVGRVQRRHLVRVQLIREHHRRARRAHDPLMCPA